jgi:hypothetical protein
VHVDGAQHGCQGNQLGGEAEVGLRVPPTQPHMGQGSPCVCQTFWWDSRQPQPAGRPLLYAACYT